MSKYLGKMHIVYGACGHVVAACWVAGNEEGAAVFQNRKLSEGERMETIDRYGDDPPPHWCTSSCGRVALQKARPAAPEGETELGSDAWLALHLLDRLDVDPDDELRVQQVKEIVRRMGRALSA